MNNEELLQLMKYILTSGRAETLKVSLNQRRFKGHFKDGRGVSSTLEVEYTVFPQYISITTSTLFSGFDAQVKDHHGLNIAKDSFVGEYLIR